MKISQLIDIDYLKLIRALHLMEKGKHSTYLINLLSVK